MSYYSQPPPNQGYGAPNTASQNLNFYPSTFSPGVGGGASSQSSYGGYGAGQSPGYGASPGFNSGFGGAPVSGRMGEQGGLRTGWLAAFSTEGYDGEPPLLEELGVNFYKIQAKFLAVLNPFKRIDPHLMDDSDIAGPILAFFLFGTFLLFSGKVHFGYIYGLALLGSTSLHFILSLMSPADDAASASGPSYSSPTPSYPDPAGTGGMGSMGSMGHGGGHDSLASTLTFSRSTSVLGYCLLPLVLTSLFGIGMPMDTPGGIIVTMAAIMWCTFSASGIFCTVSGMRGMRALVAYPLALFYVGFGIMAVFSSRGSGSMGKVLATGKLD